SLNATPFSALVLLAGLVIVNVTVVVPFSVIFAAPNALLIVGGATTFNSAVLLVVPVPPSVELIAPVVLLASPSTVPFTSTLIVGGATTVTVAVAGVLAPASVELTVTLLFLSPAVVPCTFTDTVHEALAATVPPLRLTEPEPAVAVAVPPQVLVRPLGVATTN